MPFTIYDPKTGKYRQVGAEEFKRYMATTGYQYDLEKEMGTEAFGKYLVETTTPEESRLAELGKRGLGGILLSPEQVAPDFYMPPQWKLQLVPDVSGIYTQTLITPEGRQVSFGDVSVDETGQWFTAGLLPERVPEIPQVSEAEQANLQNLVNMFSPFQTTGVLEYDLQALSQYIANAPEAFLEDIQPLGRTTETESLLRLMWGDITEQDLRNIFGARYLPPGVGRGGRFEPTLSPQAILELEPEWEHIRTGEVITESEKARRYPEGYEAELDDWRLTVETGRNYFHVFRVFGESLLKLPKQLASAILRAIQPTGASVVNKDWADEIIADASTDLNKFAEEVSERYTGLRLPIKLTDLATLPESMAFSLTSMGAGLGVGLPIAFAPVPGARVAAWAAGTAASGAVAFNMSRYQIMQIYLEVKNEQMKAAVGRELTIEEEEQLKSDFSWQATKYGLWEAVPEALSNLAFAKLLTMPLGKMVGKNTASRILSKVVGIYGQEFLTETITQKGQSAIEVESGLREGRISWIEAFKEIAPQTFLLTTILGGLGQVGVSSVNRIKQSLKKEIGDRPIYDAIKGNITEDIFAEVEAEAVSQEQEREELKPPPTAPRMTRQEEAQIERDISKLKRDLLTAPLAEREAIQRRIDMMEADLERGLALMGVVPPKAVPVVPEVEDNARLLEMSRTDYYRLKNGQVIEGPTLPTSAKVLSLEELRASDPGRIITAKYYSAKRGGVARHKLTIKQIILPEPAIPKPPAVEKPVVPTEEAKAEVERLAPLVKEMVEERAIYSEGGVPINPDESIPQGVADSIPIIQEIGVKERARPTRKVFEKMGLHLLYKGIQKAEVLIGEARQAFAKELKEVSKWVDVKRRFIVFRELENPGSQVGLTFGEKRAVVWFRKFFDEWADTLNLPQEKRLKNYLTHIFEAAIAQQLKAKHPLDVAIARALEYRTPKTIFNPFLQKRLGATVGLIEDPFAAASAYESSQLKVFYYEPLLEKIAAIANDKDTPRAARGYLKDYSRRMTGEPSKLDLEINTTLQEIAEKIRGLPGGEALANYLSRGNPSGMAAYNFTSAIYTLWLGFKATSAIRNLSQHTLIIGEVGPVHFADGIRLRLTEEGKAALDKSLVWRSRRAAFLPGIDDSFASRWVDKFRESALWMFRGADAQNVKDAFLAGYSEAKSLLPNADRQVWIDRGDEVAADTQYLYTKMNSMALSQSSIGRVFSILTTWSENWMELMTKWVSRRPSQVYLQHEKATGEKVKTANWASSYKAILMYMVIVGLGYALKERERLKAWEYTGITSIRYLANVASGDFPGLQVPGAIANMIAGFITDDERMFKQGWYEAKSSLTPGIIRQIEDVASGEKDWLTLFFYLEGKDYKLKQLTGKWEKGWKEYEALVPKDRDEYRKNNPLIEAQMFIAGRFTTLSSDVARAEVLRLIEEHKLDTELIDGYEKVFGVDTDEELSKLKGELGKVELTETGEQKLKENGELDYFTTSNFASEVNKREKVVGRYKIEKDGNALAIEYLRARDLWVPYEDLTDEGARLLFRQQFPDVEAQLYLWGKLSTFKNPKSAEILLGLMDKYGIPPESIPAFLDNPEKYDELFTQKFELEKKWFDLNTEYENYGNSESPLYIEDEKLRAEARDQLKIDNPDWMADMRRIEAIDHDAPEKVIDQWAERGKIIDDFNAGSSEAKLYLIDNPEVHRWALEQGLLTDDGSDWNEQILRLNVQLRGLEEGSEEYRRLNYKRDAYQVDFSENLSDTYIDWYMTPRKDYEDDWFLMEHMDFYKEMLAKGVFMARRDFRKVPSREVYELYQIYLDLPLGTVRKDYRLTHSELDDWLVLAKGYKPAEGTIEDSEELDEWEELAKKAAKVKESIGKMP